MNVKRASAAVAVTAFGLALGAGAASAADTVACGTPAVAAVYETVVVEGTPAITRLERQWVREIEHFTHEWQLKVVDEPAWSEQVLVRAAWTETVVVTPETQEWVVDTPAGEVQQLQRKWVERGGNDVIWAPEGETPQGRWNRTNDTQTVTVVIEEVGHWESVPAVTREEEHPAEYETVTHPEEFHYDTEWSQASPGAGWAKTGDSDQLASTFEYRWAALSPGAGWEETEESRVVVDRAATPASTKQVLVSAAVPAGPACPVAAPKPKPASAVPQVGTVSKPAAAVNQGPAELAHTGADLTLLWIGVGALLAGAGLNMGYRKTLRTL